MRKNARKSLMDATIRLVAEEGLGGATTHEIARRAGVS
jgi:AcrR family transcriptional regulator